MNPYKRQIFNMHHRAATAGPEDVEHRRKHVRQFVKLRGLTRTLTDEWLKVEGHKTEHQAYAVWLRVQINRAERAEEKAKASQPTIQRFTGRIA